MVFRGGDWEEGVKWEGLFRFEFRGGFILIMIGELFVN